MRWALLFTCIGACAPSTGATLLVEPDVVAYAQVHPWLEARCATLDCHGDPGRPLRLFAETGLRAPGIDRASPLTEDEARDNAWSLQGVDTAAAERHLAVLKPLARAAGGMHHVGGEVWQSTDDPAYRCLRGWLAGELDVAWNAACAAARTEWRVPAPDSVP
jgi:hypothetical protein